MDLAIKIKLYEHCKSVIEKQIVTAQNAIASAEESRNNETKSSVGDKYETGRAMMQNEIAKNQAQLAKATQFKMELAQIIPDKKNEIVEQGSLVMTNHGNFYIINTGLGKIKLEDITYYAISLASPIGHVIGHKKVGDELSFQNRKYVIKEII